MSYEIRAMSLAEILDTGFALLRRHFAKLAAISSLICVPLVLFFVAYSSLLDPFGADPGEIEALGLAFVVHVAVLLLAIMLTFPLVMAAITWMIGELYLGAEVSFGGALRAGLGRFVPLFVTYVLFGLISAVLLGVVFGVLVALGVAVAALAETLGSLGTLLLVLLVLVSLPLVLLASLLFYTISVVLPPVVVLEGTSLFVAIARTVTLVRGAMLRSVGVVLTAYLLVAVPISGLQLLVGSFPILGTIVWGAAQAIGYAFMFSTAVVLYFDIRCRQESFDLEHLAQMVERQAPNAALPGTRRG